MMNGRLESSDHRTTTARRWRATALATAGWLLLATLAASCGASDDDGDRSSDVAVEGSGATAADASTSDPDAADAGASDADADDTGAADALDTTIDADAVDTREGCGDGVLDDGEACDDGNRVDTDACRNDCTVPFCGDGVTSTWTDAEVFTAPAVTGPSGALARVCGDGSTCPARACEVSNVPSAPEHGICQALGYTRAARVAWSGDEGVDDALMLHAYNWICDDFACQPSSSDQTLPDCSEGQMLASITCETMNDEACDDGAANADAPDACRTDCSEPSCGDGVVDTGEGCDDGNVVDTDACRNVCVAATCGDGVVQDGEECDRASRNDDSTADACRTACVWAYCGDGVIDSSELCDHGAGNGDAPDACRADCTPARCGDGVIDSSESCDAGDANANADGAPCRRNCDLPTCGDGWLDEGEACDDGNAVDVDSCSNACELRGCGDGVLGAGEACDDGNTVNDDGCTNACRLPRCGDTIVQAGEACDDGNTVNDDACTNACRLPGCGDGVVQAGEACDDGHLNSDVEPNACRTTCQVAACGDAVLDAGEGCDEGTGNSDVLGATCRTDCTPARCGDGLPDEGEACDDGNLNDTDDCTNRCEPPRCGDGIVHAGEACDDGNDDPSDACTNACARPACGDGVVTVVDLDTTLRSPIVTEPGGVTAHVCDSGSRCPYSYAVCDVLGMGWTPEHGICQSLGYDRAVSVVWGGGDGDRDDPMVHADNWACTDYVCEGTGTRTDDWCNETDMLAQITCRTFTSEACDAGDANAWAPGVCRPDCTLPSCGDGILDPGEVCDDGNLVRDDGCSHLCRTSSCGDGVVQSGEGCDDGNDVETDGCRNDCTPATCGDGVIWEQVGSTDVIAVIVDDLSDADRYPDRLALLERTLMSTGLPFALIENRGGELTGDLALIEAYPIIIFMKDNRVISPSEATALETYVQRGGRLIITSYSPLTSPPDEALAAIARVTLTEVYSRVWDLTVVAEHPMFAGPWGTYPPGTTWATPGGNAFTVETGDEATTLITLGDVPWLTWADDIGTGGVVVWWNGNGDGRDWTSIGYRLVLFRNLFHVLMQPPESCDDGAANSDLPGGACRTDCTVARCGDGVVDPGEDCDDGNLNDLDGCSTFCRVPGCGDGAVQAGEACDDGNEDDTDDCRNDCTLPRCGDGVASTTQGTHTFHSPVVTNPYGLSGHVCSSGWGCRDEGCDVSEDPTAVEHGICQALGFDTAVTVDWGGGEGGLDDPTPNASNWRCTGYVCEPYTTDERGWCEAGGMLDTLVCAGTVAEECDLGADNSMAPDAACRPTCRRPFCGDGVVDSGEACDDGNDVDADGCTTACLLPGCGDGVYQQALGEACDDGNLDDEDACTTSCAFGPRFAACADEFIPGAGVYSGTTVDGGSDYTSYRGDDYAFGFVAAHDGVVTASLRCGGIQYPVLLAVDATHDCPGRALQSLRLTCGATDELTFEVLRGRSYLIVVDGEYTWSAGTFDLTVSGT